MKLILLFKYQMTILANNINRMLKRFGVDAFELQAQAQAQAQVYPQTDSRLCVECDRPLINYITDDQFSCEYCGTTFDINTLLSQVEDRESSYITTKNYIYNYAAIQRKTLEQQLINCNMLSTDFRLPPMIIREVTEKYNELQCIKTIGDEQKKIVKRGLNKNSILAVIIYHLLIKYKPVKSKGDIAKFMNIAITDFSTGESIIRDLVANNYLKLDIHLDPSADFIDEYLGRLAAYSGNNDIKSAKNILFINENISLSNRLNLNMNMVIKTKIAGSLWLLMRGKYSKMSESMIEKSVEGCKKNTYIKYCSVVLEYKDKFKEQFAHFNIKL